MHPAIFAFWKARRACGVSHAFGGGGYQESFEAAGEGDVGGGTFGVRRPLRFLAHRLNLSENQVTDLARILGEVKTERAQAAVDDRRTTSAFADALTGEALDETAIAEAAALRVKSAERLREAVVKALRKIHAMLDAQQRAQLAYLIRTGALSI